VQLDPLTFNHSAKREGSLIENLATNVKERDEFCLPSTKSLGGGGTESAVNHFDKTIRSQNFVQFIDFNNSNTENNQYKPALI
jgi:hypothetical protein